MVLSVDVSFDFCPCSLVVLRLPDEGLLPVVSCAVVLGVRMSHKCCKCSVTGSCVRCYCVKKEGRCVNCAPGGRQRCKNGGNRLPFNKAESASDPTREALQFHNEPALPLPQSICLLPLLRLRCRVCLPEGLLFRQTAALHRRVHCTGNHLFRRCIRRCKMSRSLPQLSSLALLCRLSCHLRWILAV